MTVAELRRSLNQWRRRHAYRLRRERAYQDRARRERERDGRVSDATEQAVKHWREQREHAREMVERRKRQLAARADVKPRIITASQLGLSFQWVFGEVGPISRWTGHYSAGPRARDAREGTERARSFHAQHRAQGWGGCSYGPIFCDDGTIILMNPVRRKGAHVAGNNTGNHGLNCPGQPGDRMTPAARASLEWYLAHAHTRAIPAAYRSPVDLRRVRASVHKDWNATACPGDYTPAYREAARKVSR